VFASYGHWRSAFVMVAGLGCLLGAGALFTLPADRQSDRAVSRTFPAGGVGLICGAIALLSAASVATVLAIKVKLVTATRCGVRPDDADRSARSFATSAERCLLLKVRDWREAVDDPAHVSRIQPAGDLRAAFFCSACTGSVQRAPATWSPWRRSRGPQPRSRWRRSRKNGRRD
jgi:hypothetical protein